MAKVLGSSQWGPKSNERKGYLPTQKMPYAIMDMYLSKITIVIDMCGSCHLSMKIILLHNCPRAGKWWKEWLRNFWNQISEKIKIYLAPKYYCTWIKPHIHCVSSLFILCCFVTIFSWEKFLYCHVPPCITTLLGYNSWQSQKEKHQY